MAPPWTRRQGWGRGPSWPPGCLKQQERNVHVVTKFLVVVAGMLSVLLAALTMAFSFNADRITREHRGEVAARVAAEAVRDREIKENASQRALLQQQIDSVKNEKASLEASIKDLQAENTQLQTDKRLAEADAASSLQKIQELAATGQLLTQLVSNLTSEVSTLRSSELAFRRREIELNDRVSELAAQLEVGQQNSRALQEQIAEMRIALERQGQGSADSGVALVSTLSGPAAEGRVVEAVLDRNTGHTFVTIDLGTNNRMRQNLKLFVVRGGEFIGNLYVTQADLQSAVARFDDIGQAKSVQVGDRVLSRLN